MKEKIERVIFIVAYTAHCATTGFLCSEMIRLNKENAVLKELLRDALKDQEVTLGGLKKDERTLN